MECYFYGKIREKDQDKENNAVVSFVIPELGISFRAQFNGSIQECEYARLLSILEFIELNPEFIEELSWLNAVFIAEFIPLNPEFIAEFIPLNPEFIAEFIELNPLAVA